MASGQLNTLIRHLRRIVRPRAATELTDAQLLERFVQGRDEAAFELLVWRHGAMVLNVCLRILHGEHDAEDAFQATFLALSRKAGAIGKRESVGSWLYKVAYRVALRARSGPRTRSLPKEPLRDASAREPIIDLLWRELRSALDEEVNRLPDKYRAAFVLCHLEGQTTEAAARTLGCPQGTLGTRLSRARQLLRRRLAGRGFDLSALAVSGKVIAALPAALVDTTVKAALLDTAEQAVAAGVISAHVAALTKGALQTMSVTKWIPATAVVLALSLIGGGAAFRAHRAQAVEPAAAQSVQVALCPPAKEKGQGVVLKWKFEKDRPFYQEITTTTEQAMKVMGTDVTQNQQQTFYFSWTPKEQHKDGSWVLTRKIEAVKMDMEIGGNRIKYDSTKDIGRANPLGDFFKALVGSEFEMKISPEMKVGEIKGRDDFINKLIKANPQMEPLLKQILGEDALKQMAEPAFVALPNMPVKKGQSWEPKPTTLNMGPIGSYETTYKYTYDGTQGQLDKIKVQSTLKYRAPAADDGNLPFKIKTADIKSEKGSGTILFDRAKGRIICFELNLKLVGKMTIDIGGHVTEVDLSQTQKTTVKTTDTNPIYQAKPQR